jgi:hypothetical protein
MNAVAYTIIPLIAIALGAIAAAIRPPARRYRAASSISRLALSSRRE